jgi:hypothetical protein
MNAPYVERVGILGDETERHHGRALGSADLFEMLTDRDGHATWFSDSRDGGSLPPSRSGLRHGPSRWPNCVECGGIAPSRCSGCGQGLCDRSCATVHALASHTAPATPSRRSRAGAGASRNQVRVQNPLPPRREKNTLDLEGGPQKRQGARPMTTSKVCGACADDDHERCTGETDDGTECACRECS